MSINLFIECTPIPFFIHFNCYTFVLTTYVFIFTPIYNFRPEEMNFNINTYIHKDIVQVYKLSKNSWLTWNSNNYYPELSLSLTRCNHESWSSCFAIRIFFDPSQQNRTLQRKTGIAGIKGGGIEAFNREQNKLQVDVTYSLGVWISLWSSSSFLHFLFLLYILFRCRVAGQNIVHLRHYNNKSRDRANLSSAIPRVFAVTFSIQTMQQPLFPSLSLLARFSITRHYQSPTITFFILSVTLLYGECLLQINYSLELEHLIARCFHVIRQFNDY